MTMQGSTYSEVSAEDRDVAAFMVAHLNDMSIWRLPVCMWVARDGEGNIVAVLALNCVTYPTLDLTLADPSARPFMRILKLWHMAEAWLQARGVPLIACSIRDSQAHFQSLVRRYGFVKIGVEKDHDGNQVETIFGKQLITDAAAPLQEGMVQ